jgi:hypothetical protein
MAQAPYIPPKDADLFSWSDNFATLITASPTTYGLVSSDATAINNVVSPWLSAYTIAVNPSTRTGPSVSAKDTARAAMLAVVRPYAIQIRNNMGVSDSAKLDLGLNIPSQARTPILVPQTQPLLSIVAATPLSHTLRYADSNSPQLRSKPAGARAVGIVQVVGLTPGADPTVAVPSILVNSALAVPSAAGLATRQPFAALQDVTNVGKIATYWARWVGQRGDVGPWSLPVSMTIAGTGT